VSIGGLRMTINYGLNRVRFVSPVPSGSRVRARVALGAVEDVKDATQATWNVTVEREGGEKPCVVAEWLVRYYPQEPHDGHEGHEGYEGQPG
jgi:acyl dehydratase